MKEPDLLKGMNSDLWHVAKNSILEMRQSPANKVTSHTTARQASCGEVEIENDLGNGMADVLAKVAALFSRGRPTRGASVNAGVPTLHEDRHH